MINKKLRTVVTAAEIIAATALGTMAGNLTYTTDPFKMSQEQMALESKHTVSVSEGAYCQSREMCVKDGLKYIKSLPTDMPPLEKIRKARFRSEINHTKNGYDKDLQDKLRR
jgi:hypothetical protein